VEVQSSIRTLSVLSIGSRRHSASSQTVVVAHSSARWLRRDVDPSPVDGCQMRAYASHPSW
jgi:hypothetical protein